VVEVGRGTSTRTKTHSTVEVNLAHTKVQFPTKVAPKEENHQMLKTKKVILCH
jgi:hypothetical protein